MKKLTEPGQEIQIDFTGKLHIKQINGDLQTLIAVDLFSKRPTVKICKTVETEEVISIYTEYRKRSTQIKGEPLYRKNTKNSVKTET